MTTTAIPTATVQNLLEASMASIGVLPRVILVEQEAFTEAGPSVRLPAIIHAATTPIYRRGQRGQKAIRFGASIRLHSKSPGELDRIHLALDGLTERVGAQVNFTLVAEGRVEDLRFYWRQLDMTLPRRRLRKLRTRAPGLLRWGGRVDLRWGGGHRLRW